MPYKFLKNYSFFIVAALVIVIESINILKGNWQSDFWEHSSAIKVLSENLFNPSHPYLKLNISHPFFSPYNITVAAFAKVAHLNSIQALSFMAFFNLVFLLFSFYRFCLSLFNDKANMIAALSLIFILFFWGQAPFGWSGFYHFMVFHYVLPYPSTFAMALTFLILSILIKNFQLTYFDRTTPWIILLSTIVFITHPNTGIVLFILIIGLNFSYSDKALKFTLLRSSSLIGTTILLSFLWPYFNMYSVLFGYNNEFSISWERLYHGEPRIAWPLFTVIPGIFLMNKNRISSFLLISIAMMSGLFVAGYLFNIYGFSRLISAIMMFTQILIAYFIVNFLSHKSAKGNAYAFFIGVCFLVCIFLNRKLISESLNLPSGHFYKNYEFLREKIKKDDLVLSDLNSSLGIPSFNGKVIAIRKPIYWVNDIKERREALNAFFANETTDTIRKVILQKYKPDYVLLDLDRVNPTPSFINWLEQQGQIVYKTDKIELLHVMANDK